MCSFKSCINHFYKLNLMLNAPKAYLKKCHVEIFHKESNLKVEPEMRLKKKGNNHTIVFVTLEVLYTGCS